MRRISRQLQPARRHWKRRALSSIAVILALYAVTYGLVHLRIPRCFSPPGGDMGLLDYITIFSDPDVVNRLGCPAPLRDLTIENSYACFYRFTSFGPVLDSR